MPSLETRPENSVLTLVFPLQEGTKEELDPKVAWQYYSRLVRRNPKDLKLHTCRVFFAIKTQQAQCISGSLHDLFYVLKNAGKNLRIRLLKASMPYLNQEETIYFAMWIKMGVNKGIGYKWTPGSVLSDGLFGPDRTLIKSNHTTADNAVGLTPLEEARSCMEYGQLDVARNILEKALEEDADNKQLIDELDYLIQYTKSREIEPAKEKPKSRFSNTLKNIRKKIFQ